ncbi:MAG: hypothetical protein WEE89_16340 [Gemmatimonadota bacterium]
MKTKSNVRSVSAWSALAVLLVIGVYAGACASGSSSSGPSPASLSNTASPGVPDPRIGLAAGTMKRIANNRRTIDKPAAEAIWNMRLVSNTPSSDRFKGQTNSDIAFKGNYAIQGNYDGYQVWDISNPKSPRLATSMVCPASQSDVSIYGNVMFVSAEAPSARLDCGTTPDTMPVSHHRIRGIRVFDATDITKPKYLANVQTCRGSHTHTVVSDPRDKSNVYVYISGSSFVRSPEELPGCLNAPQDDPNTSMFRIEVIQVPLAAPQNAKIVGGARIFHDLVAPPRHADPPQPGRAGGGGGRGGRGGGGGRGAGGDQPAGPRPGPNQCHDITVYPQIGLAGGACGGYGLLLDIRDVANPRRIDAVADSNFSYWHSATFSNDGSKVLFTDEWGGGGAPRCQASDKYEWGANAQFTIVNGKMQFQSYYKMPAAQTKYENCVAHNGSLIPIPGREVMVQGWYQGGVSVFDWTDIKNPKEIAFFDRGPFEVVPDSVRPQGGGVWSVYWYNGYMYSSEMQRGLDILELTPSAYISKNEIDAARTVIFPEMNAQEQQKFVWPPSFSLSRAYLDQLERNRSMAADRIAAARADLVAAEKLSGSRRADALNALATRLHTEAASASDQAKAHTMAGSVGELAKVR